MTINSIYDPGNPSKHQCNSSLCCCEINKLIFETLNKIDEHFRRKFKNISRNFFHICSFAHKSCSRITNCTRRGVHHIFSWQIVMKLSDFRELFGCNFISKKSNPSRKKKLTQNAVKSRPHRRISVDPFEDSSHNQINVVHVRVDTFQLRYSIFIYWQGKIGPFC